jgi:hypothetical protein
MFNLIVKDPDGDPPERAVLDRVRIGFSGLCESSNWLRFVFARTFRDYRISPVHVKVNRLTGSAPAMPFAYYPGANPGKRQT